MAIDDSGPAFPRCTGRRTGVNVIVGDEGELVVRLQSILFGAGEDSGRRVCGALMNDRRMDVTLVRFVLEVRS
jgi:hypothetical protein